VQIIPPSCRCCAALGGADSSSRSLTSTTRYFREFCKIRPQGFPRRYETWAKFLVSPDCVFDASLVPGTCLGRFIDLKGFIQQVPGESDYR
jgi:hypothetical protein